MTGTTISGSSAGQSVHVAASQPNAPPPKADKAKPPPSSGVGAWGSAESVSKAPEQLADGVTRVRLNAIRKWGNSAAPDEIYKALKAGSISSAGIDKLSPDEQQALIACALDRLDENLAASLAALVIADKDGANLSDVVAHANLRGLVAQGLALKAGELSISPPQSMARFEANKKAYRRAEVALEVMRGHDDQLSKLIEQRPELGMSLISAVRRDYLKAPSQPLHLAAANYWQPRDTSELQEQLLSALNRAPYTPENRALVNQLCAQITPSDVVGRRGLAEKLTAALVRDPNIAKLGAPETPAAKAARLTEIFLTGPGAKAAFGGSTGNAYMIIAMCNQPRFTAALALVFGENVTQSPLLVADIADQFTDIYSPANLKHNPEARKLVARHFATILATPNGQKLFFEVGQNGAEFSLSRLNAPSNLKEAATVIANNPNLTAEKFAAYKDPWTEPDFAKDIAQERARKFFDETLKLPHDLTNKDLRVPDDQLKQMACAVLGITTNDPASAKKINVFVSTVHEIGGKNPQVAPIPYTFINGQLGAVTLSLLRIKDTNGHYHFIDSSLQVYKNFQDFVDKNKFPEGRVVFPQEGFYTRIDGEGHFDLNSRMTPASVNEKLDLSSLAGGVLACGLMIVASVGTGGIAVAAGVIAGGYGAISSGITVYELVKNDDLASAQGAEAVLNLAAIALGLGGIAKGSRVLLGAALWANDAAFGIGVVDFARKAGDMTKGQFLLQLLLSSVTGGVMGLAGVRAAKHGGAGKAASFTPIEVANRKPLALEGQPVGEPVVAKATTAPTQPSPGNEPAIPFVDLSGNATDVPPAHDAVPGPTWTYNSGNPSASGGDPNGVPANTGDPAARDWLARSKGQTPGGSGANANANASGDHRAPTPKRPSGHPSDESKPPKVEAAGSENGNGGNDRTGGPQSGRNGDGRPRVPEFDAIASSIESARRRAKAREIARTVQEKINQFEELKNLSPEDQIRVECAIKEARSAQQILKNSNDFATCESIETRLIEQMDALFDLLSASSEKRMEQLNDIDHQIDKLAQTLIESHESLDLADSNDITLATCIDLWNPLHLYILLKEPSSLGSFKSITPIDVLTDTIKMLGQRINHLKAKSNLNAKEIDTLLQAQSIMEEQLSRELKEEL